ncbi:MAG: threonine--tRNA ligase [Candidatus Saccharibacteria bacterium]|nr:threonine--tRNA ligase [Candidatus Saccharibacteria bacterium]
MSDNNSLYPMRHSLAHITAAAVQRLWPEAKFGVGPVVKDGFYYDIDIPNVTISTDDFDKIEAEMRKIIDEKQTFERSEKQVDDAIGWAKEAKQPYKEELLNDLKRSGTTVAGDLNADELGTIAEGEGAVENVSFYSNGDFTDLCRGPHAGNTSDVGAFKLLRVAGAYWRGKETNPQMQRLYGVAFETKEELDHYLDLLEQAKQRDHRKLGKELDLFVTSDLVGSGLPLFTPRGTVLREELTKYSNDLRENYGFEKVWIPHITKTALYEKSGHQAKFGDELFLVKSQETSDEFVLKPMNCPHHTRIYASKPRSYRDLPVRYLETTTVYRDEKTGELGGLSRVRSITQDDSHVFCRGDQIEQEIANLLAAAGEIYKAVGMDLRVRLSYRDDGDGYLGDPELWKTAQAQLKSAVEANSLDYFEVEGEAAFYGPKIDFMATDALEREHQLATIQLDFVQPDRFELEYVAEDGTKQTPVMIHSALLGSIERFLSVYIEHTGGKFPLWLAPEQIRVIQVKDSPELDSFVDKLASLAKENKVRINIDRTNESVGKKIRAAEVLKVPYSVVVGEKELESGKLTPRVRKDLAVEGRQDEAYELEKIISSIANEARSRVQKSSI